MHLDTMLIFIIIDVKHEEPLLFLQFVNDIDVNIEGSEGCTEFIYSCEGTSWEIFMMRWAEDEHSFDVIWFSYILIGPGCSWPTVVQTSMRSNNRLHFLLVLILLSLIDVLP